MTSDMPIPYLARIRAYYQALGYGAPYEWAHYADVPFQPLAQAALARAASRSSPRPRPISPARATRVRARRTTPRPSSTPSTRATRPRDHDLRISHVAIDRKHTTRRGPRAPISRCRAAPRRGLRAGSAAVAPRFHGAADQSQPSRDARRRLPRDRGALQGRRASTPRSWCRTAPSATRRVASPRARWRRTASPPSSWAAPRTSSSTSACRASCSPIFRSATPPAGRTTRRRRPSRSSWRCACSKPRRRRGPPCSRRCAGARARTGSSTTATSSGCPRRRSRAARRVRPAEGRGEGRALRSLRVTCTLPSPACPGSPS